MKNAPLISIIMPAYNAEKHIAESIESVVRQTYANWELIIIDDGSSDNTAKIANSYLEKDCRIRYIYQRNQKQGKARNNGIENSKGKLIAFLDSDDLWVSDKLEIQVGFFLGHNYDLIFSDGYLVQDDPNNVLASFNTLCGEHRGDKALSHFFKENRIPILSVLTTKQAIKKAGGFDESIQIQNIEDYHLWIKMLLSGLVFYGMSEKLVYYRRHVTQATFEDSGSSEKVVMMFSSYLALPKRLNNLKSMAILNYGKYWYCVNSKEIESCMATLAKLSTLPQFIYCISLTKLCLKIFGLRSSKMTMKLLVYPNIKIRYYWASLSLIINFTNR